MKKLLLALAMLMPMAVFADNTAISGSSSGSISASGANSAALQGNQQGVTLGEVAIGYQVMCQNASFFKADQATKKACKIAPDGMAPEVQPLPTESSKATKAEPVAEKSVDDILAANRSEVAFLAK
jgi:hypothetical protein